METKDFISFIMPTYNSAVYVRRTLDSVLAAMDADSELVCVDDGSTDNTVDILREYEDKDPRITVIVQKHQNCSAARKAGVENSTGDYIYFVDSDDLLYKHLLAEAREIIDDDIDILVTNVTERMQGGTSRLIYSGHRREVEKDDYLRFLMARGSDFMVHGKFFRRHLFDVYHWGTDEVMKGLFHRALLLQLVCAARNRILIAPSLITYFYIRRPGSLSAMLSLRTGGVAQLWENLKLLPLPHREFVQWSLDIIDKTLLARGIPIEDDFKPGRELLEMTEDMDLPESYEHILRMLRDKRFRISEARRLVREGKLTSLSPHVSFVITAYNNFRDVQRTAESIMDTGFRNIEIIIINDGSNHAESVKINAYSLRHPRIHQRKLEAHRGLMYARLTALQMAKGYAVMWLNAGDTVSLMGLLEALDLLHAGADAALMGVNISTRVAELYAETFRNTCLKAIDTSLYPGFKDIIEKCGTPHALSSCMVRTGFVRKVPMVCEPDDYCAIDLWTMALMEAHPRLAATEEEGCMREDVPGKDIKEADRARGEIRLGNNVLKALRKSGADKPDVMTCAAEDLRKSLAVILRRAGDRPFLGKRRARQLAEQIVALPDYSAFFRTAGARAPSAQELIEVSRRPVIAE